jgi:hypothetical protein
MSEHFGGALINSERRFRASRALSASLSRDAQRSSAAHDPATASVGRQRHHIGDFHGPHSARDAAEFSAAARRSVAGLATPAAVNGGNEGVAMVLAPNAAVARRVARSIAP